MVKFLRILRAIALAVALIGAVGVLIFRMNDIGTDLPMKIFGIVTAGGLGVGALLSLALRDK